MKIRPKTVGCVAEKRCSTIPRPLLNLSITQFDPERKRVHSQPDTALFQGRLAPSHAKRAKLDRVSVWTREKERENGEEIVTKRNKKKKSARDRENRSREQEKK